MANVSATVDACQGGGQAILFGTDASAAADKIRLYAQQTAVYSMNSSLLGADNASEAQTSWDGGESDSNTRQDLAGQQRNGIGDRMAPVYLLMLNREADLPPSKLCPIHRHIICNSFQKTTDLLLTFPLHCSSKL
jgi:hypothetical protein